MQELPVQEIWADMRVVSMEGSALLHFDGASRHNPDGPAVYGYHIESIHGDELIRGYGFYSSGSSNQMEYHGLQEGLIWALRLDLKNLFIYGDSELVIRQCNNEYQVRDTNLAVYHDKISELLKKGREGGTSTVLEHVHREQNTFADSLANLGINSKSHLTVCNWTNINKLCGRSF